MTVTPSIDPDEPFARRLIIETAASELGAMRMAGGRDGRRGPRRIAAWEPTPPASAPGPLFRQKIQKARRAA